MPKQLNAQAIAQKWASNLGSATQAYTNGVNNVQISPGQSALANADKYLLGVQNSFSNGTYQKGLQSFTLQEWKDKATNKGAPRLASGGQAAKSKMQNFMQQFIPVLQNAQSQIASMPNTTYEERMARQRSFADTLHNAKGSLKQ